MTSRQSATNQHQRPVDFFSFLFSLSHLLKSENQHCNHLPTLPQVASYQTPPETRKSEGFRPTFPDDTVDQLAATSLVSTTVALLARELDGHAVCFLKTSPSRQPQRIWAARRRDFSSIDQVNQPWHFGGVVNALPC